MGLWWLGLPFIDGLPIRLLQQLLRSLVDHRLEGDSLHFFLFPSLLLLLDFLLGSLLPTYQLRIKIFGAPELIRLLVLRFEDSHVLLELFLFLLLFLFPLFGELLFFGLYQPIVPFVDGRILLAQVDRILIELRLKFEFLQSELTCVYF